MSEIDCMSYPVAGVPNAFHVTLDLTTVQHDPFSELVSLTVSIHEDHLHLCSLYVPHGLRRQGLAAVLMRGALRRVDEFYPDKPVLLETRPFGEKAPAVEVLRKFYQRFGFERWPKHPCSMVRWPQSERGRAV